LAQAEARLAAAGFSLPGFAHWTAADWRARPEAAQQLAAAGLGWDLTDFGRGEFESLGLTLFTLRNGGGPGRPKPYAEKVLLTEPSQVTPCHFHGRKMEDIIVRAGGALEVQLWAAAADDTLDREAALAVSLDGVRRMVAAGEVVRLEVGESITLEPRIYHSFWSAEGNILGEVSSVNDDVRDNYFCEPLGRFPAVVEDAPPYRLLVADYAAGVWW
jgi:D-lyxose ketol-isomerase